MIALIDGDIIAYQVAFAHTKEVVFGDDHYVVMEKEVAKFHATEFIKEVLASTKCSESKVFLSCPSNDTFRKVIFPEYKAHRKKVTTPLLLSWIRNYMLENYDTVLMDGLEADDGMGIVGTEIKDTVICTIDKDLLQIPGLHFNWSKPSKGVFEISEEEGQRFFYFQCLTGDSTDNFKGIPRVGPIGAEKILDRDGSSWKTVLDAYEDKGLTEDDAIVNARCAKILQKDEYDRETKTIKLWSKDGKEKEIYHIDSRTVRRAI